MQANKVEKEQRNFLKKRNNVEEMKNSFVERAPTEKCATRT